MNVRVKLFAVARQLAGSSEVELELADGASVADLRRELTARYPPLAELAGHVNFAVDAQYATDETEIHAGAEIACIPPVSGG